MLKSYFTIAWRNIYRRKVISIINILGLALGICACLIIYLITSFELSYDTFHPDKERIYRVTGTLQHLDGQKVTVGCVPNPTAPALRNELTGIETVAQFYVYYAKVTVPRNNKKDKEFAMPKFGTGNSSIVVAEPEYFDIFKYEWLAGNAATAMNEPFKVVLSENEARRYFGSEPPGDIIGKQIVYNDSLRLMVSGIVKDWTGNSDFGFSNFISFPTIQQSFLQNDINLSKWSNWDGNNQVLVKLEKNANLAKVTAQFPQFSKTYLKPTNAKPELGIQPLADIHFNGDIGDEFSRKASLPALYGLIGIALFILIIAAINFINLSTAISVQRAREIGIRKVLGSSRQKLVFQFLCETLLLTLFAATLAVSFVNPLLSLFHSFVPVGLSFNISNHATLSFLAIVVLVTSLLAGLYPAKVLSGFQPVLTLKGKTVTASGHKGYFRKSLIVFQFTVSLVFIIGTLIIGRQIHFELNKEMGFKKDAVVNIQTDGKDILSKRDVLVKGIRDLSGVEMVSISAKTPSANMQNGTIIEYNGTQKIDLESQDLMTDENFLPLYQLKLLSGHNFTHSDTINQLLINETAAKGLGFKNPDEAIGKMLFIGTSDRPNSGQVFPVVGVLADFHSQSLHEPIKPIFLAPSAASARIINIKLATSGKSIDHFNTTIAAIEKLWKQAYPDEPFEYSFFDQTIAGFYDKEQKTSQIINAAMAISIFISCMGLFGLITFTTEQRTKEIGVRKVLGASVSQITVMLCKDFVLLVIVSIVIATPVAWWFMHQWLQDFPYRVTISWWTFLIAGLSAICIALITVSFRAIKAAAANPVKSLRTE